MFYIAGNKKRRMRVLSNILLSSKLMNLLLRYHKHK